MKAGAAVPLLIAVAIVSLPGCDDDDGIQVVGALTDTVSVTISGATAPFNIDPDPAIVRSGDRLEFQHATSDMLEIDLRGVPRVAISPFADSLLMALGGGITFTTILAGAEDDTIKYSVTVTIGGQSSTEDPEIIVRPR